MKIHDDSRLSTLKGAGKGRRRDEVRDLFRAGILEAAEDIFAVEGFHGARVQDIAARARTAVGTVYNHFDDKEDLLRALIEERTEELLTQLQPSENDSLDFAERLAERLGRLLHTVDRHRGFFSILFSYGFASSAPRLSVREVTGEAKRYLTKMRSSFRALIEEGIGCGALEPLPADDLSAFLGGAIRAICFGLVLDEGRPLAERASLVVDLFMHGAARREKSGER